MTVSKRRESNLNNPVKYCFMIDARYKNYFDRVMLLARGYLGNDLGIYEQGGAVFLIMAQALLELHRKNPEQIFTYISRVNKSTSSKSIHEA